MRDMYVALVIAGKRTCNPETAGVILVPARWRAAVMEDLEALGLDADGQEIVVAGTAK
ncbi:MAG: CD1375 family protein [Butyricicoccus sp.]